MNEIIIKKNIYLSSTHSCNLDDLVDLEVTLCGCCWSDVISLVGLLIPRVGWESEIKI